MSKKENAAHAALFAALGGVCCLPPAPKAVEPALPWWMGLVWLWPLVRAFPIFIMQLVRPWAILLMAAVAIIASDSIISAVAASLVCVWLVMLYKDEMFQRSWGFNVAGHVQPGVFFKKTKRNIEIVKHSPWMSQRSYTPTWWLWSGDWTTLYPALAYKVAKGEYERRWVKNDEDGEILALDWAFPATGFNPSLPVLLLLHGLNGGSQESYLLDLVHEATRRGWTVCVLIARGLMGTPITSGNYFHGARISDVHTAAMAIERAIPTETKLVAAGYSMGGIILSNYMAQKGERTPVTAAVSLAGCFDSLTNKAFLFSRRVWQPLLAFGLKQNFAGAFVASDAVDALAVSQAYDIVEFDMATVVPLNGYTNVDEYYKDHSANCNGKLAGLRVPLLAVNACDDPIVDVNTIPVDACEDNDSLFFLITRTGGHVGWPMGASPSKLGFSFMTEAVLDFTSAVTQANAKK